jgi:hypothetical protein
MKRLTDIGFLKAGYWFIENDELQYNLTSFSSEKNILYCFIWNNKIKYIGKTVKTISQRMYGYKNPSISQRTNYRVNKEIKELLKNGNELDICILTDNGLLKFGDFRINIAAGLEDTLIAEIKPEWNYNGKNNILKAKINRKIMKPKQNNFEDGSKTNSFIVTIGQAYYNDGFFNVRVKHSELFGGDKSPIKIQLGENSNKIISGYVNRTANNNGTPRIMAGQEYTKWMKENFQQGDVFKVDMINSDYIKLMK